MLNTPLHQRRIHLLHQVLRKIHASSLCLHFRNNIINPPLIPHRLPRRLYPCCSFDISHPPSCSSSRQYLGTHRRWGAHQVNPRSADQDRRWQCARAPLLLRRWRKGRMLPALGWFRWGAAGLTHPGGRRGRGWRPRCWSGEIRWLRSASRTWLVGARFLWLALCRCVVGWY